MKNWFAGELIGTFVLVFCGCGAVATSVAWDIPVGLFQVAVVWGLGLSAAIFLCGSASGAHFNPAITLAFAFVRDFPKRRIPGYFAAQFLGAFLAAALVFVIFGGGITQFESQNGIARGEVGSEASAMIFGEYFPNPGALPLTLESRLATPHWRAFCAEMVGTGLLALTIFGFTARSNTGGPGPLTPIAIGMTLTVLICLFAPVTMAGFNPARDLSPRIFSSLAGWGSVPFTVNGIGWFTVYIIAPCVGALVGAFVGERLYAGDPAESDARPEPMLD
ncbi:MAG: MIP/aquaporin family protein [Verrucomicrobiia bacterium]|jgi:glycerol uptake facilitator protein